IHTGLLKENKDVQYGELHIFLSTRFIILIQHKSHVDYRPVEDRCQASPEFLNFGAGFILYAVLD
ncbi:MAG TPA: magnesium transporter, partial [Methylococcaceae bacterium]|nr:magnesium transporter [Methylococcaceae bacterium]